MLSFVILLILVWQFYIGYSRGIILQLFYVLSALLSLIVAVGSYKSLAQKLALWVPYSNPVEGAQVSFFSTTNIFDLGDVYYAGVAFVLLVVGTYIVCRFVGVFLHLAPIDHLDNVKFNSISGVLSVLISLLFLSMCLTVFATIPISSVQNHLSSSALIKVLVNHIPIFSSFIQKLWLANIS